MGNLSGQALVAAHWLAHVNAALNGTAAVLLVAGLIAIKGRREILHRRLMLGAFGVSTLFLACYLAYHVWPVGVAATPFPGQGAVRVVYYVVLASHVVLAMLVPPLAAVTIFLGLRDDRARHRRLVRWTFPIWLYVSVTGVAIYVMLYHIWEPADAGPIIP